MTNKSGNYKIFDIIDSEEKAYWLGFLTADGNVYINEKISKYGLQLTLQYLDLEHIEKFKQFLECPHKILINKSLSRAGFSYSNKYICYKLCEYGVIPRKSLVVKPYLDLDESLCRHYWRGLIDGDGCLKISSNQQQQISISLTGTYEICLGFLNFCKKYIDSKAMPHKHGKVFDGKITGPSAISIMQILYDNSSIFLNRKKEKYLILKDIFYAKTSRS